MGSKRCENLGIARRQHVRSAVAAASAMVTVLALAGCVPSSTVSSSPSPSSTLTVSASPTSTPVPTPDPLIIPGCDTMLPLATAKSLFSTETQALGDANAVPLSGYELPEIAAAATNASIAKNCVWGIPNSDGGFSLAVTDISATDAANLKAALLAAGFLGVTTGGLTTLELEAETELGSKADTHYLTGDLWIHSSGTSLQLSVNVANDALDSVRLANPTRTY
ncbi:hypothetical protein [Salinibacterium sp. PAMC 21357]|uniref:hypothetical protein n=1 Tax=Salinibacterium sp. PAMC 21357 TaxID=1112215 RepID=UPI00114714FD|nr:hypothetical protein [Salinibacterium sp. PAMC 21357]